MRTPDTPDDWYATQEAWHHEVALLRAIALEAGLDETVKWNHPCYTDRGRNIAIVGVLNDGAILSFLKGVFLEGHGVPLIQPGRDRSGRYAIFDGIASIAAARDALLAMLRAAVEVERAGKRVPPLPDAITPIPELQERLDADPDFREAFDGLTPGRQRQYNLHFGDAKRSSTRVRRIEAATERILAGKGLRDCICGKSQRYPQCDGSHRSP